jgi:uncharacterized membrane protein YbhN (UPF0104 family)
VTEGDSAGSQGARPTRRAWYRDWRFWTGIAITVLCMWYAMRGISLASVASAMGSADQLLLFGLSVPAYLAAIYVRGLRWRQLTKPFEVMPRGVLVRGVAVGFMVNNLLPLRIGEFVRAWYVAREVGASGSAILGTVVLERVIDVVCVVAVAVGALALTGVGSGESGFLRQGALLLLPVAIAPLGGLILIRAAPEWVIAVALWCAHPFPERVGGWLERNLRNFADGLGALSGGRHLFWIALHSIVIWVVLSVIPMLAGLLAFDLELGSLSDTLITSWIVLGAVGVAVAVPSAPGFLGTYQLAFRAVLERFGVDSSTALALGLMVWLVFWLSLTVPGLLVLRFRRTSLGELTQQAS